MHLGGGGLKELTGGHQRSQAVPRCHGLPNRFFFYYNPKLSRLNKKSKLVYVNGDEDRDGEVFHIFKQEFGVDGRGGRKKIWVESMEEQSREEP